MATEIYVGRVRSLVTHVLLCVVTLGIYLFVWYYNINRELYKHSRNRLHPALLLLLFILVPVVGWFVAMFLGGVQVRRVQVTSDADKRSTPWFPALWGLVPVAGWIVATANLQAGANRAWMGLHRDLSRASEEKTLVECPDCTYRFEVLIHPFRAQPVACPQCKRAGEV